MSIGTRFHEFAEMFYNVAEKYKPSQWKDLIHPDFIDEEKRMLENFINREIIRYNFINPDYWLPLSTEYKLIDHTNHLRGIIDKIEQIDDNTIAIVEYKTGSKITKRSLQLEFGFYDIILDTIPELEGMRRLYYVYNPRLDDIQYFTPSRRSTIINNLQKVYDAMESNVYHPSCTPDFQMNCTSCTMEELLEMGIGKCCSG
jgi:hypothetical protein